VSRYILDFSQLYYLRNSSLTKYVYPGLWHLFTMANILQKFAIFLVLAWDVYINLVSSILLCTTIEIVPFLASSSPKAENL
jgi:hypothetical protein